MAALLGNKLFHVTACALPMGRHWYVPAVDRCLPSLPRSRYRQVSAVNWFLPRSHCCRCLRVKLLCTHNSTIAPLAPRLWLLESLVDEHMCRASVAEACVAGSDMKRKLIEAPHLLRWPGSRFGFGCLQGAQCENLASGGLRSYMLVR